MENADKALPGIFINVFGAPHKLAPTFGTFCRFEKATGKNAMSMATWATASATDMVTLIWAALGGEGLGKSVNDVAEEVSGQHLEQVRDFIQAFFKQSEVPEAVKKDAAA